jgi:hypothetical protein
MGKMSRPEGEQSDYNGTEHKERTMKKLLLIVGLCVPWTAFAQTYQLYLFPNSPNLTNPLGPPRIVTGTDYMNALANYNNSLALQQYLQQQQMNQAGQQLANGIATLYQRKQTERMQAEQNRLAWENYYLRQQITAQRKQKNKKSVTDTLYLGKLL